jgi:hypothetical protein
MNTQFEIRKAKPHELTNMREKIQHTLEHMKIHDAIDVKSRAELNTALRCANQLKIKLKSRKLNAGGWTLIRIQ